MGKTFLDLGSSPPSVLMIKLLAPVPYFLRQFSDLESEENGYKATATVLKVTAIVLKLYDPEIIRNI